MTNPVPVLSDDALREVEARAERASSGPWMVTDGQHIDQYAPHPEGNRLLSEGAYDANYHMFGQNDVEFIAHAREDIPALCATVQALRNRLQNLESRWDANVAAARDAMEQSAALREQLAENARRHFDDARELERRRDELKDQLAHWQERTRERTGEVERLQSELARVTRERDEYRERLLKATETEVEI